MKKTLLFSQHQVHTKVLLSLLFCFEVNCSHIKPQKLKPLRTLKVRLASITHLAHHC